MPCSTDKSQAKPCGTSCNELDFPSRVVLEPAWDQRHVIYQYAIGFIQMPRRSTDDKLHAMFSYYEVLMFEVLSYANDLISFFIKYFLIIDATLDKMHESARPLPCFMPLYSTFSISFQRTRVFRVKRTYK